MSAEHVERERIIQSLARALFVQHRNGRESVDYRIAAAFRDAEEFIDHCQQRERRARRQRKGSKAT